MNSIVNSFKKKLKNRFIDNWLTEDQLDDIYVKNYSRDSVDSKRFYNIGAGGFYHWAWTNIDKVSDWYKPAQHKNVVDYDLFSLKPIPVTESGKGEVIYASHVIEHVTDDAVKNLFLESHRILKDGGYIRVTSPDVDLAYRALKEEDRDYFYWQHKYSDEKLMKKSLYNKPLNEASVEQLFISHFASSVSELHADGSKTRVSDQELAKMIEEMSFEEMMNTITSKCDLEVQYKYPGNHINWWNTKKTIKFLNDAGFKDVRVSSYGQSYCPVLRDVRLFDNTHPKFSFYVEARK